MIYNTYVDKNRIVCNYTRNNKLMKSEVIYRPFLFTKAKEESTTKYKDIYGNKTKKILCRDIYDYQQKIFMFKNGNVDYLGDIDPIYQYIIENFGNKENTIDEEIKWYVLDIEAFSLKNDKFYKPQLAKAEIKLIQMYEVHTGKFTVWGYKDYEPKDLTRESPTGYKATIKKENVNFIKCKNEIQLLKKFIQYLRSRNVQILSGFNTWNYDNTYIIKRLQRLGIEQEFYESARETSDGFHFPKIQNIDYRAIYKKFSYKELQSFSLNGVCEEELGFKKIDFDGGFGDFYKRDYETFVDYGIIDVLLIGELEKKCNFIKLVLAMSNKFFCNPIDTLSVTKYWDTYIYSEAYKNDISVPRNKQGFKTEYLGGYVRQPIVGLGEMSTLYDIESSYPTNMRKFDISPERIVDYKDLPKELFEKTYNVLNKVVTILYKKYKHTYTNKSGSKKDILGKEIDYSKNWHYLYEHEKPIEEVYFPHFFVVSTKKENIKLPDLCTKVDNNKYLLFCLSKKELILKLNNFFKGYVDCNIIKHVYIAEYLTTYFSTNIERYQSFYDICIKYKLMVTPNLQYFRKEKYLGIMPRLGETVFFERKAFKKKGMYDQMTMDLCKYYIESEFKPDKDRMIGIGSKIIPKDYQDRLKNILISKDVETIENFIKVIKAEKVIHDIFNLALKITINSEYGYYAATSGRYYDVRLAESITTTAQVALRGVSMHIERLKLAEYKYSDTDSSLFAYAHFDKTKSTEENFTNFKVYLKDVIEPEIHKWYSVFDKLTNSRNVPIKLEREIINEKTIFLGKKRYYWKSIQTDGSDHLNTPHYKGRGIETRRSDTPKQVSKYLEKFLKFAINGKSTEYLRSYLKACKKAYMKLPFYMIAKTSSTSKMDKYKRNEKGIPAHYLGVFLYNNFLNDVDSEEKYKRIESGNKIKWGYLDTNHLKKLSKTNKCFKFMKNGDKMSWYYINSKTRKKTIAEKISFPEEYAPIIEDIFKLDYETMHTKAFKMCGNVFEACGWELVKTNKIF